jgi:UDP-N-acetylglucosamine--N-acetylmuramyl-(pentapeptide) pyrophosphoryl-undecaprenol N-acetylglucosamine transferase
MALNKYSILIPIPTTSQNEQLLNARALEEIGLSYVIEQKDLSPETLNKAIFDVVRHKEMNLNLLDKGFISTREKTQALVKLNSAEIIVDESLKLL